ncbi:MAG: hypothetical protein M0C28_06285 [Candidatus Moduliflexus flocculans]|nr:hypothetical protein [Candidatus Moduliflexus flocculans]
MIFGYLIFGDDLLRHDLRPGVRPADQHRIHGGAALRLHGRNAGALGHSGRRCTKASTWYSEKYGAASRSSAS